MPKLTTLEVWSELEVAGGVRLAAVPERLAVQERRTLDLQDRLEFSLPFDAPSRAEMTEGRVIRCAFDDATFQEWRLNAPDTQAGPGRIYKAVASPVAHDLSTCGYCKRVEASGQTYYDVERLGLSPAAHVALILADAPAHFAAGVITPSAVMDLPLSWDTPLSALRALAQIINESSDGPCELAIRWTGSVYAVDLVTAVGSAAAASYLLAGKNITSLTRGTSRDQQVTRILPRGAGQQGEARSIAAARWEVTAINGGAYLELEDPDGGDGPARFADQFNTTHAVQDLAGGLHAITDTTVISATVTRLAMASTAGFTAGDRVRITLAAGADVTTLPAPAAIATYGVVERLYDRPDLPGTQNLVANPFLDGSYSGGLPSGWTNVGAGTPTENTDPRYARTGGKSVHYVATADGQGIQSAAMPLVTTPSNPYVSGYLSLQILSGRVRVELVDLTNSRKYPDGTEGKAWSSQEDVWTDLGVQGLDLHAVAAASVALRVVADGGAAEFYVDSAQLTQGAGQLELCAGDGPRRLWQAANVQLDDFQFPLDTLRVDILDLSRAFPEVWPYDVLVLGGTVEVRDPDAAVAISTRIAVLERDLLRDAVSQVELSNRPTELTDLLLRPPRRVRQRRLAVEDAELRVSATFEFVPGQPSQKRVTLSARPAGASIYYIVQDQGDVVPEIGRVGEDDEFALYGAPFVVELDDVTNRQLCAYAQLGSRFSPVQPWILDRDEAASATLGIGENPGGTAVVAWVPDDDVAYVLLYRKKNGAGNGWPTLNNNDTGVLDQAQLVGKVYPTADGGATARDGTPLAGMAGGTGVGGTQWSEAGYVNTDVLKCILVPVDRSQAPGARVLASRTMTGAASYALSGFTATQTADGSSCADYLEVELAWTFSGGPADANVDLRLSVQINGGGFQTITTLAGPVTASPSPYTHAPPYWLQIPAKGGQPLTLLYRAELLDTGGNVLSQATSLVEVEAVSCPV